MSQLFTLQFPKYHFDVQREFTLNFQDASNLPFSYDITNNMVCCDRLLHPTEEQAKDAKYQKELDQWKKIGLQEGVRIICINGKNITDEHHNEQEAKTERNIIIQREDIDSLIRACSNHAIDITFREEILEFDDAISLGLTYDPTRIYKDNNDSEDNKSPPPSKSMQLLGITKVIKDIQIGASSYEDGSEPSQCRLNNPHGCWKPKKKNMKLRNSYISIDLKEKKMVTKLHMQGDIQNKSYVTSIWIDYSNDSTTWICHNSNGEECELQYNKLDHNIFGVDDNTVSNDKFAEVSIWPPIHARFIKIRVGTYCHEIAMRFDLYGPSANRLEFARVIEYGHLSDEDKKSARVRIKHCNWNTRLIQVDCRAVIRKALNAAQMSYVGFVETDKSNYLCVFSTADLTATERTIEELMDVGIGRAMGVAGICPMQFRRPLKQRNQSKEEEEKENKKFKKKHGVSSDFYASIKSRQIVDRLVDDTTQSAEFTYDYMSMLLAADVIAAMGLGTNSAVIVVASMLVSPIMGPVLALTFGVHLRKFKFAKALAFLGLKNELWSLLICILVGFIVGFVLISITENDPASDWPWPTNEMTSRGNVNGLATGAIVAFASGVGVALSVVGDAVACCIGVAISASLLPPAVNCGMMWAMSLYVSIWPDRGCNGMDDDSVCYTAKELGFMGLISIVLTVENIILVFLASWMMFIIKDVTLRQRDRAFDEGNRQLVYQGITSFKDRYADVKMRSSNYSLSRQKKISVKHLSVNYSGEKKSYLRKPLNHLTVDKIHKERTLKKTIMSYNTMKHRVISRTETEMDGILEDDDEDEETDDEFAGGHSKIKLNMISSSTVQKIPTDSLGVLQENEPLVQTTNDNTIAGVMEVTEDDT